MAPLPEVSERPYASIEADNNRIADLVGTLMRLQHLPELQVLAVCTMCNEEDSNGTPEEELELYERLIQASLPSRCLLHYN